RVVMKMDRWLLSLPQFISGPEGRAIAAGLPARIKRLPIYTRRAPAGVLGACPQQGYGAQYEKTQDYLICDFNRFCAPTFHARNYTPQKSVMSLFFLSCKAVVDIQFKLFQPKSLHDL